MRSPQSLCFKVTILWFVFTIAETNDFCKAFEENGYSIDFSFRRLLSYKRVSPIECLYLIIGNQYYILEESPDFKNINIGFNGTLDLDKPYSLAFGQQDFHNDVFISGFLRKDENTIDWLLFEDSTRKLSLIDQSVRKPTQIAFLEQGLVFDAVAAPYATMRCVLHQEWSEYIDRFNQSYRCIDFSDIDSPTDGTEYMENEITEGIKQFNIDVSDDPFLTYVESDLKVVLIGGTYSHPYIKGKYLFVYIDKQSLKWCFTPNDLFFLGCTSDELKLLIDCSSQELGESHEILETFLLVLIALSLVLPFAILHI